jgi:hypothetical protein
VPRPRLVFIADEPERSQEPQTNPRSVTWPPGLSLKQIAQRVKSNHRPFLAGRRKSDGRTRERSLQIQPGQSQIQGPPGQSRGGALNLKTPGHCLL